ncbi:DUF4270 family protein [Maribacter ulvicola]|uniref:DUF4270 domain-containing protein n=1 Tax=Maribacter ulvicola TaxID=228959 RepID=A0A1N6XGJ7_9FLAO|nr:DUF4270 family protein [Maribacter ulvicola]SIR01472.1 protein of unknown function [Maribacter ulvicola]
MKVLINQIRALYILIVGGFLTITVHSCSDDIYNNSEFVAGETFTDSNIRLILIDTLTVSTSTMKFDSLVTSESTRILAGKYTDEVFGTVTASSYMQFLPKSYTIDSEAVFDSIVMVLSYDNYYYNDTLQKNTLRIKKIAENLNPESDDYFYNTSSISYDEADLGFHEYNPRPLAGDSIIIKLVDDFGTDVFSKLQEKKIINSDEYRDYFKGIGILPDDTDNGSIIGFSKSSENTYMRLYYSTDTEYESKQDYLDIQLNALTSPIPFFNSITAEDPISPLQTLTNSKINLESSDSYNQSYVQSGVGIAMRIQFPSILSLYDIPGNGTILDGTLKIRPVAQSYNDNLKLRDTLAVYVVNQKNELTETLSTTSYAILNRDNQEFNDIYYEIPLAYYLEELQLRDRDLDDALILLPTDYNTSVDRFIMSGNGNEENETILELTYGIYDED